MTQLEVFSESQTKKVKIFSGAPALVASKLAERSSRHVQMCAISTSGTLILAYSVSPPLPSPPLPRSIFKSRRHYRLFTVSSLSVIDF